MSKMSKPNYLEMLIRRMSDSIGVVDIKAKDNRNAIIKVDGSVQQLADILSSSGTEPIKIPGQTKAMEYCEAFDAYITRDKAYMLVVFAQGPGYKAIHFIGCVTKRYRQAQ